MKKCKNLRVKTASIVIILAILFSVAFQCQSNMFPTSKKTTSPTYKETYEPYVTGACVPDNTIEFIFNNAYVQTFMQRFKAVGYVLNDDSLVIYNVYDEKDSSWHRMYYIPLNHPTERKEANVLFVKEGIYYTVSAHIWEKSPGMVDTMVFKGVEFPFHDIWCFQLYGAIDDSISRGGGGGGGGNKMRDRNACLRVAGFQTGASPTDSSIYKFLDCFREGAAVGCGFGLGTCLIFAGTGPGLPLCAIVRCGSAIATTAYLCYKNNIMKKKK